MTEIAEQLQRCINESLSLVAVDPGLTGAWCYLGNEIVVDDFSLMDDSNGSSIDVEWWADALRWHEPKYFIIEDVWAMPHDGRRSLARFIRAAAQTESVARVMGIPVTKVRPQTWKKDMALGKGKDESLAMARRLFPEAGEQLARKKDHNRAEALLLGEWARRYAL